MRRSKDKDAGPGLWEAISGRVEVGEEPLAAARREVAEETGLSVRIEPRPVTASAATRLDVAWLTASEFAARSSLTKLVEAVAGVLSR